MNIERSVLITFLGNYLINTVAAALVSLVPASAEGGLLTPQYIVFVVLAVVSVAALSLWYTKAAPKNWKSGALFGITGFLMAIVVAFVTGVAGVLSQTGSFTAVVGILPNFWPFIANTSTIILLCYWVIPAALTGWWLGRSKAPAPMM